MLARSAVEKKQVKANKANGSTRRRSIFLGNGSRHARYKSWL